MFNGEATRQQASTCRTFENIAVGIWLHDKLLLLLSKIKGRFYNTGTEANGGLFAGPLENPKFCYIFRKKASFTANKTCGEK